MERTAVTIKPLATGVSAIAIIGAAAAGVTFVAPVGPTAPQVQLVVFGAPPPLDPADAVPTPDQLLGVLNGLEAPGVPFASKGNLVEGGIVEGGPIEARLADGRFQQAVTNGALPLAFNVANIQPSGAGAATADVTASDPKLAPTTRNVTFANQGGWKISRASVMALLQEASAGA
jgi:hypothetical protein